MKITTVAAPMPLTACSLCLGYMSMISVVLGFHLCVSRRSLQLTLALVCWCWLGCFLLVSAGELIFDLFLTSSNNLTATVESNAATEKKKTACSLCLPTIRKWLPRSTSIQAVHTLQPGSADMEYCCLAVTPTGFINCIIHASAAL